MISTYFAVLCAEAALEKEQHSGYYGISQEIKEIQFGISNQKRQCETLTEEAQE